MTPSIAPAETDLSVVVPAFNEADRLAPTLRRMVEYLDSKPGSWEIIVVDDGSTDDTARLTRGLTADQPRLRLIELGENRGKGAAVRAGVLAAKGAQILFSDADLSTPIEELEKLQVALEEGYPIAIASRAAPGADIRVRQGRIRELMGRTFNTLVQMVGVGGFQDTQCGFKLFSREAAKTLFEAATVDGFAFDVEILLRAKGRYPVAEIPVVWRHVEESKVSPGLDAARMFIDLLRLRLALWRSRR